MESYDSIYATSGEDLGEVLGFGQVGRQGDDLIALSVQRPRNPGRRDVRENDSELRKALEQAEEQALADEAAGAGDEDGLRTGPKMSASVLMLDVLSLRRSLKSWEAGARGMCCCASMASDGSSLAAGLTLTWLGRETEG